MARSPHLRGLAALLLPTFVATACSAPPTPSPATEARPPAQAVPATAAVPAMVLGKAFLEAPIAGATLSIRDVSGQRLQETANATDANGFFAVPLPEAAGKDFRVEITGGTRDGEPSTLVLKADARGHDPLVDRLYLNAATTLAAARLDLAPSASLAQTQAAVRRYLKLPESVALGTDLDNPQLNAFSHAKLMQTADAQGGFDALIRTMAADMAGGGTTSHDFSSRSLQVAGAIAKTIALEIGKGALGKIGGSLMGWGLDAIFGSGDDGSQQRHEEVLERFAMQRTLFFRLDNRIGELQGNIDALKASIAALEASMNQQFGLAAYNTKVDALLTSIAAIDGLFDAYMDELDRRDGSSAGKARVEALANDIRSRVPTALTTIHLAMVGTAGGDGAITQWHRLVGHRNRNGENGGNRYPYLVNATFIDQLNDGLEYFEGVQLRGITLLVEARNFRQDSLGAKSDHDRFMANLDAQKRAIYSTRLEGDAVLISPYQGVMWDRNPLSYDGTGKVTFPLEVGSLPTATINTRLGHVKTLGFTDWRMPTDQELYHLGAPTNGRYSDFRTPAKLQEAGFHMAAVIAEKPNFLISASAQDGKYAGLLTSSGVMEYVRSAPNSGAVLPARTFKQDPHATL